MLKLNKRNLTSDVLTSVRVLVELTVEFYLGKQFSGQTVHERGVLYHVCAFHRCTHIVA